MTEYITLPVMGALIGYGTNWLAIKMVFRPYEEKRIFGLRVPFTPGVMAKERYNFSKKLGNTLSDNVITDEELAKYFQNIDFNNIVKNLLDDINVDKPLSTFINDEKVVQALNNSLKELISTSLKDEEKTKIAKTIVASVKGKFKGENLESFLSTEEQVAIINSFKNNDEVYRVANNLITSFFRKTELLDMPLQEVLGDETIAKLLSSLEANGDKIRLALLEYVKSEDFKYLEGKIEELVAAGVGKIPMAAMFGGSALGKMVTPLLIENAIEYLEDEEHNEEIVEVLNNILTSALNAETKKALGFVSQDIVYMATQKIIVNTCNSVAETVKSKDSAYGYRKIFEEIITILEDKLEGLILNTINNFISDEEKLDKLSKTLVEGLLNVKLNKVVSNLSDEVVQQLGLLFKNIIDKNLSLVIEQINISEIVESKINTFEMKEAERLVVDVMNKELKMITNLGGVLGFIIGCFSILI